MKKTIALLAALALALTVSLNAFAIPDPDARGTKLVQIQGGAFPGMGAILSGNIAMANMGKAHLYGGLQLGVNLRTGAVTDAKRMDLSVAPRFTLGFNLSKVIEFHFGGLAGVAAQSFNGSDRTLEFCYGGLGGFRFNFSPSFGMVAEGCYSEHIPYATLGFAFRF